MRQKPYFYSNLYKTLKIEESPYSTNTVAIRTRRTHNAVLVDLDLEAGALRAEEQNMNLLSQAKANQRKMEVFFDSHSTESTMRLLHHSSLMR